MALPIAPTPFLTGKDAVRFDRLVADGLKHPLKPKDIQVDWEEIHRIQREIAAKRKAARPCAAAMPGTFRSPAGRYHQQCRAADNYPTYPISLIYPTSHGSAPTSHSPAPAGPARFTDAPLTRH